MRRRQKYILKQNRSLQELTVKRTRVPNFTVDEKKILTKLVDKRKDVIECKATDTKSIIKKKEAWLLIEKEFNLIINVYKRDHTVLKTAWDNIKAQTRKVQVAKRDNLTKPEGKSPAPPSLLQKEIILKMVEEVACIKTSEESIKDEKDLCLLIKKPTNQSSSVTDEVNSDLDEKGLKEPNLLLEQIASAPTSHQTSDVDSDHLSIDIDFEPDHSPYRKSEDSNDEIVANSLLHTTSNGDPISKKAELFLKSLQSKNNVEYDILRAKLQTALLEQQAAEISLQAARLDLALLAKRLKN